MVRVEAISAAPLVRLSRLAQGSRLFAKAEHLGQTGSVYDRIAGRLLDELAGVVGPRNLAIAAGSGSLCLSFASAYPGRGEGTLVLVCPESTLPEHRALLEKQRVTVVCSDRRAGLFGTHARALEEAERRGGHLVVSPRKREGALLCFEESVGEELRQMASDSMGGRIDTVVAPVGSGALLMGIGRALDRAGLGTELVGTVIPSGEPTSHQDGVVTADRVAADFPGEAVAVSDQDAFSTRRELARTEGILVGLASAAAVHVARERAERDSDRTVVAILVDAGDRYFSVDRAMAAGKAP